MPTATYSVLARDARYRAVMLSDGYPPTMDASALLGSWHRDGFRYMAPELARHLGALVAVVRDPATVPEIMADPDGFEWS